MVEAQLYEQLFVQAERGNLSYQDMVKLWIDLPKFLRGNVRLAYYYAKSMLHFDDPDRAAAVLRDALHKQWHPALVYAYGLIESSDKLVQLNEAEAWLKQHGKESVLLLTLGRLALRNELWGKARAWLEASMGIEARTETCQLLGNLLEKLGETEKAAECYRKGLQLAPAGVPALPSLPDIKS